MGPNQTYKLLHSKGNHKQNKNTILQNGKKVFANDQTDKDLIFTIHRTVVITKTQPNWKIGRTK